MGNDRSSEGDEKWSFFWFCFEARVTHALGQIGYRVGMQERGKFKMTVKSLS